MLQLSTQPIHKRPFRRICMRISKFRSKSRIALLFIMIVFFFLNSYFHSVQSDFSYYRLKEETIDLKNDDNGSETTNRSPPYQKKEKNNDKDKDFIFRSDSCASYIAPSVSGAKPKISVHSNNRGNIFSIKIYESNDIVSNEIRRGGWEREKVTAFNKYFMDYSAKHNIDLSSLTFIDIGANVGWFTFSLAALGVNVIAFEPMEENINLIKESMCLEENIKSGVSDRITLYGHGLGVKKETCILYSHNINVGDGHVKCVENESDLIVPWNYSIRGRIPVRRLDDVLDVEGKRIVALKLDTEGYEGNVLEGGTSVLLQGGIEAIVTEFVPNWIIEKGGDPVEFMRKFSDAGYLVKNPKIWEYVFDKIFPTLMLPTLWNVNYFSKEDMLNMDLIGLVGDLTMHSSAMRE